MNLKHYVIISDNNESEYWSENEQEAKELFSCDYPDDEIRKVVNLSEETA